MKRIVLGGGDKDAEGGTVTSKDHGGSRGGSPSTDRPPYDDETVRLGGKPTQGGLAPATPDEGRTLRFGARRMVGQAASTDPAGQTADVSLAGWLVVVSGSGVGSAVVVRNGLNRLGRDPDSDIALPFGDRSISSSDHCHVIYDPKSRQFSIQNGVGRNLTYVDDELAVERKIISRGALISLGDTVLRFVPFCDDSFDWADIGSGK